MKKTFIPFTYKIIIAFMIVLLPIFVAFLVSINENRHQLERLVFEEMKILADSRMVYALTFLAMSKSRVQDFASDGHIREETKKIISKGRVDQELNRYLREQKLPLAANLVSVTVIGLDGKVLAATSDALIGMDVSGENFFEYGKEMLYASEWRKYPGQHVLAFSIPLYAFDEKDQIGVLAGFMPFERFGKVITGEYSFELGAVSDEMLRGRETLEVYIVNRDRLMITESRFVEGAIFRQAVDTEPVRACLERGGEISGFYRDYRGIEVAGVSKCIPAMNWVLLVEIDQNELLAPVRETIRNLLITGGITLVFVTALVVYFIKISGQLKRLGNAARSIAAGDYEIDLPIRTHDELGLLSESFNAMARSIKDKTNALRDSEARLKSIMDNTINLVILKDLQGRYFFVNRRFIEITGVSKEDIYGKTAHEVFPKEAAEEITEHDKQALASDKPLEFEETYTVTGTPRTYLTVRFRMLGPDEEPYAIGAVSTEITELNESREQFRRLSEELEKRVEERTKELEAANRELEAFSYSVAHDLRTPLRIIDGFSKSLMDKCADMLDDQGKNYILRLRSASARMGELIDDLLALSRVMLAEMKLEKVDLSSMAQNIAQELRNSDPERQAQFTIEKGLSAIGDERLLNVLMENLIGNAWKFTGKREQTVIEFGQFRDETGKTGFFVRDNGAGFDMRYAYRLFAPFQRLHSADEFAGTGVGLATVYRIVQRHGGKVWAKGEVNKGATFYFTLG